MRSMDSNNSLSDDKPTPSFIPANGGTETDNLNNDAEVCSPMSSNPLLVGIVLDNIFQYFSSDLGTLKSCRLVCTTWHEAATKQFRKIAICIPMRYRCPDYVARPTLASGMYNRYQGTSKATESVPDSIYKGFFHQALPAILPYEKIYITENIKGSKENRVSIADAVVTKWFRDWGPHMKGIRLKLKTFHNKTKTSPFLGSVLTQGCLNIEELELLGVLNISFQDFHLEEGQLSKIKKLVLRNRHAPSANDQLQKTKIISQIESILAAVPNVQSLVLDIEDHLWAHDIVKLATGYLKNLTSLQWCSNLHEKHVREMERFPPQVQLRSIDLNCKIVSVSINLQAIRRLLTKFAQSLEFLRITCEIAPATSESDSDSDSDFDDDELPIGLELFDHQDVPLLVKLKSLEMGNVRYSTLEKFKALQKFPSLEKIILKKPKTHFAMINYLEGFYEQYDFQLIQHRAFGNAGALELQPHPNLVEFKMETDIKIRDFFSTISFAFPNLKVLDVCVHSERAFNDVFRTMRSLEELNLKFRANGFAKCNSALVESLHRIQKLKRLTLEHLGPYPFQLTEATVILGLKSAENLRWLHLKNFAICQNERESILDHLKHYTTLKFTNCVVQSNPINAVYGIVSNFEPFPFRQGFFNVDIAPVSCDIVPPSSSPSPSSSSSS